MRTLIQVVNKSSVRVDEEIISEIKKGYCIFVGFKEGDNDVIVSKMAKKIANLRIFKDENGKTNLSIKDVGGKILLISQFTLYANCIKGNRPSFIESLNPSDANKLYEHLKYILINEHDLEVNMGSFGSHMLIDIENDGPFTIYLDSDVLFA